LDNEKDKLDQLQQAVDQNARLKEQISIMARQIELQQELASKQVIFVVDRLPTFCRPEQQQWIC
jgi:hypothetical protein